MVSIVDLDHLDPEHHTSAARILHEAFRDHWPGAWPTLADARDEVAEALSADRIALAALEQQQVLGWIGAQPSHGYSAWELHPLVVAETQRARGIGRLLVRALEERLAQRSAVTLWLGTDDETELTSLAGRDLYPDVLTELATLENRGEHPFTFYQRLGFSVVGVIPDANGPGKPDILMAKRIRT
ncbi:MAG TPA: GNAT family N-acetyltransferase [Polyangiaceae bacterium]|nr:GNAT family N-acetyltransferase [Polyangiaceae bacterium]